MIQQLKRDLQKLGNAKKAKLLSGFFKTGKGEYGEGDIFLGVVVPEQRKVAKKYKELPLKDIRSLLRSKMHEERLTALFILVEQFEKNDKDKKYYDFYLRHTKFVNNWDLVDLSAPKIVGAYLLEKKEREILYTLAKSNNLWQRRIAIIATLTFIKHGQYADTLKLAHILRDDTHDLLHKAVGWTLREVGKKDQAVEEKFLRKHHKHMPRTMLRYAIERFSEKKRKFYMKK